MPVRARIVVDLLVLNGRVLHIVRCLCGDKHVLGVGKRDETCYRCGTALALAEPS